MAIGTWGYCDIEDLDRHLEGFANAVYGSGASATNSARQDIEREFRMINDQLRTLPWVKTIPIATQADGSHPQVLVDWNAKRLVYVKSAQRHFIESDAELPQWIIQLDEDCDKFFRQIADHNVQFEEVISISELGIGRQSVATQTGIGTLFSNYNTGEAFVGPFPRTFIIEIDGTTDGNNIEEATFKWSMDAGQSWEETGVTIGTAWYELTENVKVRGQGTIGSGNEFNVGDQWKIECVPEHYQHLAGTNTIRVGEFLRGGWEVQKSQSVSKLRGI